MTEKIDLAEEILGLEQKCQDCPFFSHGSGAGPKGICYVLPERQERLTKDPACAMWINMIFMQKNLNKGNLV